MSWSIRIAGPVAQVAAQIRRNLAAPNRFPDSQQTVVLSAVAATLEGMPLETIGRYNGAAIVEGAGHQGSNFSLKVDFGELPVEPVAEPLPTAAPQSAHITAS